LLERAMKKDVLMSQKNIELKETEALLRLSGTVSKLLNVFELVVNA
jgi:putative ATPase